jgi:hypothetical protein
MIGAIVLTHRKRGGQAHAEYLEAEPAPHRRMRRGKVKSGRRAGDGTVISSGRPLSRRFGDPLHARRVRHLPEPQERHRHPDVDRADPARGEHQPRGVLLALGDLVGQVFAMFVLTVAAAEAAIGLAILVIYFRNRGTIAVEDVNVMKG